MSKFFSRFRTYLIGAGLLLVPIAYAALTTTPTDLRADDISRLRSQLTASATTATLQPVKKYVNGSRVTGCFDTPAGFILIEDSLGRKEWASYDTKACSSDYVTTLSGMRRGLSPTSISFAAGTGLAFDAGASVRVIDYPIIYNNTVYKDTSNTLSASGGITFSGSGSVELPYFATLTELQRQLGATPDGPRIGCSVASGICYIYMGGSWQEIDNGATANATETVAGKVELGNIKDMTGATITGDTGAATAVLTRYLTLTGATTYYYGRIPLLGRNGTLSGSLLGTGTRSATTYLNGNGEFVSIGVSGAFFGEGGSGAIVWSNTGTNLNKLNPNQAYNFTTASLLTGATLTVSVANKPLIINTNGDVTISGIVNLTGSGAANGVGGGAQNIPRSPTAGTAGTSIISGFTSGLGGAGSYIDNSHGGGGGGGGGAYFAAGSAGANAEGSTGAGSAGTTFSQIYAAFLANASRSVVCGAGGGGGGGGAAAAGGNGGKGGGCMTWFIGGDLTLGFGSSLRCSGNAGTAGGSTGSTGGGGGGGGGAGGTIVVMVAGSITNNGAVLTCDGGAAGAAGAGAGATDGGIGGAGAAGKILIYSIRDGTVITN